MAAPTSAALCSVSVSQDVLDKDLVLNLILKTVQSRTHQLTLTIAKKPTKDQGPVLTLTLADGSELTSRHAILRSLAGTAVGERVTFEGIDPDVAPEPENKVAKKKIFEQVAPDLKTNDAGHVVWKSHVAKTSAGVVQALHKMANASVS